MQNERLVLASTSEIRAAMLRAVGLNVQTHAPRVDEHAVQAALRAAGAGARDIADALAEAKARKVSHSHPDDLVLGCDQTLDIGGTMLTKPADPEMARQHLHMLQGQTHHLFSAAVVFLQGAPIWRHVGHARMSMRPLSPAFIASYVDQHWPSIRHAVGCYKIEEAGARLFSAIEGDQFTIQGLPLIPLLNYLVQRGAMAT